MGGQPNDEQEVVAEGITGLKALKVVCFVTLNLLLTPSWQKKTS